MEQSKLEQPKQPKVLLIDDDQFIVDMYVLKFKEDNFEINTARDGKEGLAKVKEFNPDVILLDIIMPVMDGFQVLEELRKDAKPWKVILLTNLGQKEDVEHGMRLGADDYVVKAHFTPSEVVEKVRRITALKG